MGYPVGFVPFDVPWELDLSHVVPWGCVPWDVLRGVPLVCLVVQPMGHPVGDPCISHAVARGTSHVISHAVARGTFHGISHTVARGTSHGISHAVARGTSHGMFKDSHGASHRSPSS